MPDHSPQLIVTTRELSKLLKVSPRTISNYIATRRLPYLKIGGSVRFALSDVMAALSKFTVKEISFLP